MKKFTPTYHAVSIYAIEPFFFATLGVKTLLIDLDNTLASHDQALPSEATIAYLAKLQVVGLKLYIVSNNTGKRVKKYAEAAGLPFISGARKPLAYKIRRFLKKEGVAFEQLMMIGDQIVTDVFCANSLGVKIILTEKLVTQDLWITKLNRGIDSWLRRRLVKKNLLKEWNENGR